MKDTKEFVTYLQNLLRDSAEAAFPHFERKALIQRLYDGDIDAGEFGTMSELYIPALRTAVKKALPDAIQFAFPTSGFVSLKPTKEGVSFDQVSSFEGALDHMMLTEMRVKQRSVPIFQDAIKFGSGYGIIEKTSVSVVESGVFSLIEEGKTVAKERALKIGQVQKLMPNLRHIPYECVIPSVDGATVDECSCVMVIDYYRQDKFLDLYKSQEVSKTKIYSGNPQEIIKNCIEKKIDGIYPHWWNIKSMSGETTENMHSKYRKVHEIAQRRYDKRNPHSPIMVPVVKYFFDKEQVWLANGDTIIFHDKDSYETMRKPILKASVDFDSNNWWALSDIAASRDMAYGINAYNNAMMDLLGQYLRPMITYDKSRFGGEETPRYEPWGVVPVNGNVQGAFQAINPAPMPNGMTQFGEMMKAGYNDSNMEPLGGQASPGLVRGGSFAFESLLQTQNAPREMAGMLLDMGFIEPLISHTMIQMQTLPQADYEYVELADREFVARRITLNDVRYSFEVCTDTIEKMRNSINEQMAKITMYMQVYKNNPWIKQQEALADVIGDKEEVRKLLHTEKEYKENMAQMQQAQAQAQQPQSPEMQGRQP